MVRKAASLSVQGQRGGCTRKKRGGVPAPHSLNSFVFCGLSLVIGFPRADTEKSGETIATPPRNGGSYRPRVEARCTVPLHGPRGSLSSVFIPAGRLGLGPDNLGAARLNFGRLPLWSSGGNRAIVPGDFGRNRIFFYGKDRGDQRGSARNASAQQNVSSGRGGSF